MIHTIEEILITAFTFILAATIVVSVVVSAIWIAFEAIL